MYYIIFLLFLQLSLYGTSPISDYLLFSAEKGHIQNVKKALQTGADINSRDYFGKTPLILAASRGDFELVSLLFKFGAAATMNFKDRYGKSALDYAKENGHEKIVIILKEYGAKD
jgi:ankyrin repeat protein